MALRSLMGSPFSPARVLDRVADIKHLYQFGAHEQWIAEYMFAIILIRVNDFISDLPLRISPRLTLNGKALGKNRSLVIISGGVVRRRLAVRFDDRGVLIGENYVLLNGEAAVVRLVNALVDEVERVWNALGR